MNGRTIARLIISQLLLLALLLLISGCGGGSGGGSASSGGSGQTSLTAAQTGNGTGPDSSAVASGKTGTFTVTVQLPKSAKSRKVNGKVIPYGYKSLKVNIQGEATTKADTSTITLDGNNKYQKTISDVPVGLNVATIQILDASNSVLAQRTHGFYMTAGGSAEAGATGSPLPMGVSVTGGVCSPLNIDIPKGTTLFFENLDATARTVTVHCDGKTDKTVNLDSATGSTDPDTPATYPDKSIAFNSNDDVGTWSYTSPSGSGSVLVYDNPAITALTKRASQEGEEITITGTSFGRSQTGANGTVTFGGIAATAISSWSDTSIKATVPTGAKSGPLVVTAHGLSSSNNTGFTVMKAIDGGTFTMGSNSIADAQPTHSVTVSPFFMGKFEVTNAEFCAFLNDEGNLTEGGTTWWEYSTGSETYNGIEDGGDGATPRYTVRSGFAQRPVVFVSWYGTVAFCNWASEKDGLTPCYGDKDNRGTEAEWRTKNGYRLATEAENEYACRAGTTTPYYWGTDVNQISANCWWYNNSEGNHHGIGSLAANAFGLYDMRGNVWEYCNDWYVGSYPSGAATDPTGPGSGLHRVIRGGSWTNTENELYESAWRHGVPADHINNIGFRIVRSGTCASMSTLAGGTFTMGQTGVATPTHQVTVSPFYAGRYEITNTEYCAFLNDTDGNPEGNATEGGVTWWNNNVDFANGILDGGAGATPRYTVQSGYEKRPVVYVSWYGAVAYCNWASTKDELTPCYGAKDNRGLPSEWRTRNGYRLATEAEWEYACRAGTDASWPWYWGAAFGATDSPYCWYTSNSGGNHHDVGGKTANAFGLFDMSGNVEEWCSDWHAIYTTDAAIDPTGPETGGSRVFRGGSFSSVSNDMRSAIRREYVPSVWNFCIGFRLVRTK
ncbi:MAG: SUMF1/EgtB/PvdO family nonheme iron enzyme [Candidatus Xenobiia bacterium LiM19]